MLNRLLLAILFLSSFTLPTVAQTNSQDASAEATISGNNNTVNQTIEQTIIYHPGLVNRREKTDNYNNRGRSHGSTQGSQKARKNGHQR